MTVQLDLIALGAVSAALVSIMGLILMIYRPLKQFKHEFNLEQVRNRRQDVQILDSMEQRKMMYASLLAIMDGLKEIGCNHNVTTQREILFDYLNHRPFSMEWYKDENYIDQI